MVNDNIREGAALTFIVLLIFLRSVRSTFVIFLSISVSIVGMFLLMSLMGRSLNVLSLAGIAFAVGMLVDNFIVVLENIYRHYQSGEPPLAATVRGTQEVWGAVLAATLANLAVFVPVLFVQDQAGQLFRDIALAASSALVCSLLVALVVVPTAAARILRSQVSRGTRREAALHGAARHLRAAHRLRQAWLAARASLQFQRIVRLTGGAAALALLAYATWTRDLAWVFAALGAVALVVPLDGFGRGFVRLVVGINAYLQQGVLRRIVVVALLVGVSLGLSYLLMPKREYLPNGNRNLVVGLLFPPPGYNLDQMAAMGRQVEARLKPYWNIAPGEQAALSGDRPAIADLFYVARGRNLFLGLRALDPLRAADLVPLLRAAAMDIPGVLVVASQRSLFESGLTAGRTIDIDITGPEITRLVSLGGQIMGRVMESVKVSVGGQAEMKLAQARPNPSLDLSNPEMHIIPKWQQAADMGVSAQELGYTVDALVDGAYAGDYFMGGDKIDISIIGQERFAARTQDLPALSLAVPSGELVSLAAVAEVRYASGPEQINHRRRLRAITIQVTPPPEMPLEDAMDIIRQQIIPPLEKSGQLSGGYQITLSGTADKLVQTWRVLGWNLALAVVITYLLMAALFESWLYPLVIILSVPLGAVGGFAGLSLLNFFYLQTLDVMTMLGFIILVGTVVNNPILIIEQALVHIRDEGLPPRRAVLESVRTRIRPIFMTALIGLFGLLPLVISPGAGSELYRGLGSVLLGGLLTSTVFTLVLVPTLFSLAMDARHGLARLLFGTADATRHGAEPQHVAPVPQRAAARVPHSVQ
jgi:HAE1 family hydrophobic/amphiphilic exporter-1